MEIPVSHEEIEINGRKFRLNKLDARTGSYMLFKLTKIITPILKGLNIENIDDIDDIKISDLNFTELASSIFDLPEKEFRYIQDNCLRVVEEILPAGPAKVIDKYGKFGVMDIEFDTALLMNLTIQSLVFNVKGFFAGSPLTSIMEKLITSLQNSKM
ncbi:phage tail assembly chaperone [Clostridium botulinum]|uniref:phage tail assembly chaperone n=1 Tax=Clostridium botulinum TaxID=1491 RepID=UPI003A81000F